MDQNTIISIVAILTSVGGTLLAVFNHKRCRSHCLGTDLVASIDVENTTPTEELKIKIPKTNNVVPLPPSPTTRIKKHTYDV